MKILVTGTAGFIGNAVAKALLDRGDDVIGVDNMNDFYEVSLKHDRLARLASYEKYTHYQLNIADYAELSGVFSIHSPERVINLAAQASVRYSLENPQVYVDYNIQGFFNIIEACRHFEIEHLVYASTSSAFGANGALPWNIEDSANHQISFYAATKKCNEILAHSYSHLYNIPMTGLRFFTVYGPWSRPDMAMLKFTKKIMAGEPIDVYGYGVQSRDFTYIDDIVEGVIRSVDRIAQPDPLWDRDNPNPASSTAPWRLYNIGSNRKVSLLEYIEALEDALGVTAEKNMLPMQPGDIPDTMANVDTLIRDIGYEPRTTVKEGVARFVEWYLDYYC